MKRTDGDASCTRHQDILNRTRFNKWYDRDIIQYKELCATKEDVENDPEFKKAWIVEDRHYFNPDAPLQKTVESENIRRTFEFANKTTLL